MHMKKIIIASLGLLLLPNFAFAAFNDVTLSTGTNIFVGGYTLNVTGSNAVISSIVVNVSDFSVTLASGSSIQVTSPTHQRLSVDVASFTTSYACADNTSVLTLASSGGSGTVTVTPQAAVCSTPISGEATPPPSPGSQTAVSTTDYAWLNNNRATATPNFQACTDGALFNVITGQRCSAASVLPASMTSPLPAGSTFNRNLSSGMTHPDVENLQKFLNAQGLAVSQTGAGSPGSETNFFGPATRMAVQKFQIQNGIVKDSRDPGYGLVGPKTRALMNALFGKR